MGTSETYAAHLYNNYQYQQFISDINSDAVYHYTTSDTLFKIVEKKQLRFTNRLYLNDCSEGRYVLDLCIKRIDDIWAPNCRFCKNDFLECLKMLREKLNLRQFQFYQVSFSTDGDNLTMWNYYSKGDGINIQFSKSQLLDSLQTHLHNIVVGPIALLHGLVIYDEDEQIGILRKLLNDFSETGEMLNEWGLFTSWAVLNVGTFFKHKGFRDEREYRIAYNLFCDPYDPTKCLSLFSDNDHNKPYSFDVYQKEGMMVPFVDVDISSDSFQAVTLSPRIAAEYYADGLKLMLYKHGLWKNNINIQKSSIPIRF